MGQIRTGLVLDGDPDEPRNSYEIPVAAFRGAVDDSSVTDSYELEPDCPFCRACSHHAAHPVLDVSSASRRLVRVTPNVESKPDGWEGAEFDRQTKPPNRTALIARGISHVSKL